MAIASRQDDTEIVKLLLGHPQIDLYLHLVHAATRGRDEFVEMLLSHPNIDVNLQDKVSNISY